jgi:hypothetical protein
MVDLQQSTKNQQEEGKLMGIAKSIKNPKKKHLEIVTHTYKYTKS